MEVNNTRDSIDPTKFEIISLETIIKQVDNDSLHELRFRGSIPLTDRNYPNVKVEKDENFEFFINDVNTEEMLATTADLFTLKEEILDVKPNIERLVKSCESSVLATTADLFTLKEEILDVKPNIERLVKSCESPVLATTEDLFTLKEEILDVKPNIERLVKSCESPVETKNKLSGKITKWCYKKQKNYYNSFYKKEFPSSSAKNKDAHSYLQKKCEVCPLCGTYFSNKSDYLKHKVVHEIRKKPKQFNLFSVKSPSLETVTEINYYNCEKCSESFSNKNEYDTHLIECQYKCKVCSIKFKNSDIYNKHISVNSLENPFYCEKCSKWFNLKCFQFTKCSFNNDKLHKLGRKISNSTAKYNLKVEEQLNEKYPKPENLLICNICQTQFEYKLDLRNHRRLHESRDKPYSCKLCSRKFTEYFSLTTHLKNHPFLKCETCSKKFVNHRYKKLHRCYQCCNVCSKLYPSKYQLTLHKRIHTDKKLHICKICSKGFATKQYIKKHEDAHLNGKLDDCQQYGIPTKNLGRCLFC